MKAEIVSIGTELMLGQITDTNASYLASRLPELGIDLLWVTQVGDNLGRMKECLQRALGRSDLVLVTGGLGPTEDDLTREAIAEIVGEKLAVDPELERSLREFFSRRGYNMPESNIKQATVMLLKLRRLFEMIKHIDLVEKLGDIYFICGEAGAKDDNNLPNHIHICPAYGCDWFQVYEKTDKTFGPEW